MNKKISLGAAIAFMLIVATATFSMTMIYASNTFNETVSDLRSREVMFEKYSEVDRQVRQNSYGAIDETVLMDSVAAGYLNGIGDKYSQYYDAKTYERMTRTDEGNIVGIGATYRYAPEGYLEVAQVYPDSPALAAGIEVGDLIIKVDDTDLTMENSTAMREAIQGEPGTKVALVVRKGTEDVTPEPLTRRAVIIPTVRSSMDVEQLVGYIIIDEFGDNTSDQFNRELQKMIDAGAKSLVVDLRDNPGGNLKWAARILDKLLPAGPLASSTDRFNNTEMLYSSDANEIDLPIVLVTNGGTASAAELFAQSLKDYGKARSVGTITAGKGIIQEIIKLSDGSALQLTIAQLNSASGETFNTIGVKPDYEVALEGDWKSLTVDIDAQLSKAYEVAVSMQKTVEAAQQSQGEEQSQGEQSQGEQSEVSTSGEVSASQPADTASSSSTQG